MDLDELNRRVTNAIAHADSFEPSSVEALAAFRAVSRLEEAIANETAVDDVQGEIARLGAVTAALSADEPLRALQLAERYLGLTGKARTKLDTLRQEAEAVLAGVEEPAVEPVGFTVRSLARR